MNTKYVFMLYVNWSLIFWLTYCILWLCLLSTDLFTNGKFFIVIYVFDIICFEVIQMFKYRTKFGFCTEVWILYLSTKLKNECISYVRVETCFRSSYQINYWFHKSLFSCQKTKKLYSDQIIKFYNMVVQYLTL